MVSLRDALMLGEGGVISLVGAGGKTSLMFRLAHELEKAGERVLTTTTTKIYEPSADQSAGLIVSTSTHPPTQSLARESESFAGRVGRSNCAMCSGSTAST